MKLFKSNSSEDELGGQFGLLNAVALLKSNVEIGNFLQDLCTPAEIQAMADRWRVVVLIKQGVSYRDIHAATGVSLTTISRVARYISFGTGSYNLIYDRVLKTHDNKSKNQNCAPEKRASK
ncbi:MAG: YerC/YecD family TrpR-related protein [Gammaproteobacteria bacterium]